MMCLICYSADFGTPNRAMQFHFDGQQLNCRPEFAPGDSLGCRRTSLPAAVWWGHSIVVMARLFGYLASTTTVRASSEPSVLMEAETFT